MECIWASLAHSFHQSFRVCVFFGVVVLGYDLVDCPAILGRNAQFNCPRKLDLPGAFEFGPSDCDTRCICETWVQPFFIGAGWGRSAEDQFDVGVGLDQLRSEEHTSELQSLMRISYAVFCLK